MRYRTPVAAGMVVMGLMATACSGAKPKSTASSSTSTIRATEPASGSTAASAAASSGTGTSAQASKAAHTTSPPQPKTAAASKAPAKGAVDPNAPEVVEPGDIPDNQAFVAFPSADGYSVDVPEGWARTQSGAAVTFTDKYNAIKIESVPAAAAPTPDSVKAANLGDVSVDPTYRLLDVKPVTRKGGTGVVALFEIGSPPNKVTGKKALLAVERYVFFHNGKDVVLTLSGAKGADNVDPWKTVSDSLKWR